MPAMEPSREWSDRLAQPGGVRQCEPQPWSMSKSMTIGDKLRAMLQAQSDCTAATPDAHTPWAVDAASTAVGEDALRILMTVVYPRLAASRPRAGDYELASRLLRTVESEACHDIRFLDAFNVYAELAPHQPPFGDPTLWPGVAGAYRRAIAAYTSGTAFEDGVRTTGAPWSGSLQPPHPALSSIAPVERVLVLADNPSAGWRIHREVTQISGLDVHVLICRPRSQSWAKFAMRQGGGLLIAARRSGRIFGSLGRGRWTFLPRELDDPVVVDWIAHRKFDIGLHGMGVIYRRPVLEAFRHGILNAHIGLLPPFRGRSVVEWSLLSGAPLGTSVFFIDEGIDTGDRFVLWRPASKPLPPTVEALRAGLFAADGTSYAAALSQLRTPAFRPALNDVARGQRYYVMSQLLRPLAQWALDSRRAAVA